MVAEALSRDENQNEPTADLPVSVVQEEQKESEAGQSQLTAAVEEEITEEPYIEPHAQNEPVADQKRSFTSWLKAGDHSEEEKASFSKTEASDGKYEKLQEKAEEPKVEKEEQEEKE